MYTLPRSYHRFFRFMYFIGLDAEHVLDIADQQIDVWGLVYAFVLFCRWRRLLKDIENFRRLPLWNQMYLVARTALFVREILGF